MTLKLNFNTPIPHSQRGQTIKAFRDLGLSYERIYQSGEYSLHRFFGRLPTVCGSSDVDIINISVSPDVDLVQFKDVDFIEIYLFIERE